MAEDTDKRQGRASSNRADGAGAPRRGFAGMDQERQREIARAGGRSVPNEKRSFSRDHGLAAEAGRKGGENVPPGERSFSQNRELAAEAGRKGGRSRARRGKRVGPQARPG